MASKDDKTTAENTATEQQKQASDGAWPVPGDEGYVIPDGTPQAARQLEDNKRAAADRAAAGSSVHGAPAATPGPQLLGEAAAAQARADEYSGPTMADAHAGTTQAIREGFDTATEKAEDMPQDVTPSAASTATADGGKARTADQSGKGATTR
jgi:hypothetical protein